MGSRRRDAFDKGRWVDDQMRQAEASRELRRRELKQAVVAAYRAIQAAQFTSQQVINSMPAEAKGVNSADIRKLGMDSDARGWPIPRKRVCEFVDEFGIRKLGRDFGLVGYLDAFARADKEFDLAKLQAEIRYHGEIVLEARREVYARELPGYLLALEESLSKTVRWIPYLDLSDGFEARMVSISEEPPVGYDPGIAYDDSAGVQRGDVGWQHAIVEVPVAVVLADAGFGKSWLVRQYAKTLCEKASRLFEQGGDPASIAIPMVIHAADLAREWRAGSAGPEAAVTAAVRPRQISPTIRQLLAGRFEHAEPVTVLIDAYDEIFDDGLRASFGDAVRWLHSWTGENVGLLLTSRRAGYDDPFDRRTGHPDPLYMTLGLLDEPQVRHLWETWYTARSEAVPTARLEPAITPESPLRRFVRVPLIAAFCAWVAETETVAPTRAGLYGQVIDKFLALSWKDESPHHEGMIRQDGARRAAHRRSLADLAWHMATSDDRWRDDILVADCDRVLAHAGPAPPAGHSHAWEPIRYLGILTQPSVFGGDALGDAPVMWIHRSVAEYMAATWLVDLPAAEVAAVLDRRSWFHPAWANVLDFAVGIESAASAEAALVTEALREHATRSDDGLGWFATVLAAASGGLSPDAPRRESVVARIWSLHRAGLITSVHLARVLALVPEADDVAIVELLIDRLAETDSEQEVWDAIAWTGAHGRSVLADLISSSSDAAGAARALYAVDPATALEALSRRIVACLPLHSADASLLRVVPPDMVELLVERYLSAVTSVADSEALAWTQSPRARETFMRPELIGSADTTTRAVAVAALGSWYRNNLDQEGFAILLRLATEDPDPGLRMRARFALETAGGSVPWVKARLHEAFSLLYTDPSTPPITDLETLAANLSEIGPEFTRALTMVRVEPRLRIGPIPAVLRPLTERALRGELDVTATRDLLMIGGASLIELAIRRVREADMPTADLARLIVGLTFAAPHDTVAYAAIVAAAARHRHLLIEGALRIHEGDADSRIEILIDAMRRLEQRNPAAVQVWSAVLRKLLLELPYERRRAWRTKCGETTAHVLALHE
ncbi:NACHT domain-containing protein [Nocardia beijingensis]|uniref:NACHT domain-containing protein n=1 Tax=Nocardia beijingensis TaxID=95162 RepID=A0ABW7W9Q7_9NOCA